jgi:hypothetical protein
MMIVLFWQLIVAKVFEFPEYTKEGALAAGPCLHLPESRFKRQLPGKLLSVTVEMWLKLDDWWAECSVDVTRHNSVLGTIMQRSFQDRFTTIQLKALLASVDSV